MGLTPAITNIDTDVETLVRLAKEIKSLHQENTALRAEIQRLDAGKESHSMSVSSTIGAFFPRLTGTNSVCSEHREVSDCLGV
jgi:hypothetical protein